MLGPESMTKAEENEEEGKVLMRFVVKRGIG